MKKVKMSDKTLKMVEKIARREIENNLFGWPPDCAGIYHQPKRPKKK